MHWKNSGLPWPWSLTLSALPSSTHYISSTQCSKQSNTYTSQNADSLYKDLYKLQCRTVFSKWGKNKIFFLKANLKNYELLPVDNNWNKPVYKLPVWKGLMQTGSVPSAPRIKCLSCYSLEFLCWPWVTTDEGLVQVVPIESIAALKAFRIDSLRLILENKGALWIVQSVWFYKREGNAVKLALDSRTIEL